MDSQEDDILIIDPSKLVDAEYLESEGRLRFKLSQYINQLWVDSIKVNSWNSIIGFDVDNFRFKNEYSSVRIPLHSMSSTQGIVDSFKGWVENANKNYPNKIKSIREKQIIKEEIRKQELISRTMENIKI